jgi:hypothetical protein
LYEKDGEEPSFTFKRSKRACFFAMLFHKISFFSLDLLVSQMYVLLTLDLYLNKCLSRTCFGCCFLDNFLEGSPLLEHGLTCFTFKEACVGSCILFRPLLFTII